LKVSMCLTPAAARVPSLSRWLDLDQTRAAIAVHHNDRGQSTAFKKTLCNAW
jgi:hypothetical protein